MYVYVCMQLQAYQGINNFLNRIMAETFINCLNPENFKKRKNKSACGSEAFSIYCCIF